MSTASTSMSRCRHTLQNLKDTPSSPASSAPTYDITIQQAPQHLINRHVCRNRDRQRKSDGEEQSGRLTNRKPQREPRSKVTRSDIWHDSRGRLGRGLGIIYRFPPSPSKQKKKTVGYQISKKQGRIHSYPSRVRVGRGSDRKCHLDIWAGAVT